MIKFPKKYIKKGKFKLHSGQESDVFYDVNSLLTEWKHLGLEIIESIDNIGYFNSYVGIATGGAIIASQYEPFAMIKDGELKGRVEGDYCLIDDVVTTETSIREAIDIIGYEPKKIIVCVDRRENKELDINAIYSI